MGDIGAAYVASTRMERMSLHQPFYVYMIRDETLTGVYHESEYACTYHEPGIWRELALDAALQHRVEELTPQEVYALKGRRVEEMRDMPLRGRGVKRVTDTDHTELVRVKLDVEDYGEAWFVLKAKAHDDTTASQREMDFYVSDEYSERVISTRCINHMIFSRGLSRYWTISYGSIGCLYSKGGSLSDPDMVCGTKEDDDLGHQPVRIMDYVTPQQDLIDFLESGKGSDEDVVALMQVVLLNLQIARETCGFSHNNINGRNILVKDMGEYSMHSIAYASDVFSFRVRYVPVISDYAAAIANLPYDNRHVVPVVRDYARGIFGFGATPGSDAIVLLRTVCQLTRAKRSIVDACRRSLGMDPESGAVEVLDALGIINPDPSDPSAEYEEREYYHERQPVSYMLGMGDVDTGRKPVDTDSRVYPTEESVEFWTDPSVLDQLSWICEESRGRGEYLAEFLRDEAEGDLWDDYFLVYNLRADVAACPMLLGAVLDRTKQHTRGAAAFEELCNIEDGPLAPTESHIRGFDLAWAYTMSYRYEGYRDNTSKYV